MGLSSQWPLLPHLLKGCESASPRTLLKAAPKPHSFGTLGPTPMSWVRACISAGALGDSCT